MSEISHQPVAPTRSESRQPGDVVARHRHDEHQLVYVSEGVLSIRTAHGSWIASKDRGVWIPAHTWHEHRFYGSCRFHTLGVPLDRRAPLSAGSPTVVAVDALLSELLVACTGVGLTALEQRHLRAVVYDRLRRAPGRPLAVPTAKDRRLAAACRLVTADLRHPRSLAELAGVTHSSERTLARLFRAEFGATYPQWRRTVRVFHAMVLLADGASVTDTAYACGWSTPSAFIDAFGATMGTTPGQFGRSPQGQPPDPPAAKTRNR